MNITLRIERLVLDGLPLSTGQSTVLRRALEQELTQLLSERELQTLSGGAIPQLSVASIELAPGGQPAQWGRQIARSLSNGLAPASADSPRGPSVPPAGRPARAFGTPSTRQSSVGHLTP